MGFQQGLSGLNSSSKALDTIGNNISNSSTAGFKAATTQFADVYASSLSGGSGNQIGIGSSLARVSQQFTQGNVTNTSNPLDMAINGSGFYRMSGNGAISYSRAGQFQLDKDGYVVSSGGLQLTGYSADPITGTISPGSLVPLQVVNSNISPQVTSASQIQLNMDSRSLPPSAMSSGSLTGAVALSALTTITQGVDDVLDLVVDGVPRSVTIPPSTSYTAGGLATTLQSLINSALSGTGASVTVSNSAGGQLTITSDSKGTLGSFGSGSSVTLNGTGGPAASKLLGAPVATVGAAGPGNGAKLTGGAVLPTSVTIGSGESFSFTTVVAAGPTTTTATVSLPAGTYATTGGAGNPFETMLQTAVDTAFPPAGTLTVTAQAGTKAVIQLTAPAAGDTVSIGTMTSGVEAVFAPTTVAGKDNFNQVSNLTSGTLTSAAALTATVPAPTTITTGTNDILNVTVDGHAVSVALAQVTYDGTAGKTLADLAQDVQAKINTALGLLVPTTTARVTAGINASSKLVIQSNSTGSTSTVALGAGSTATVLGAVPIAVTGSQTQTINPLGFTASTAQTVYDSQGNAHNLALYFAKTSQANIWQMYSTLDNGQQQGPVTLQFDGTGALVTSMPVTLPAQGSSYAFISSSTNATAPNPLQFTLDLSGTTQYGVSFGVNTLSQDGFASGQLSGMSVASDGVIQGRYSNGKTKNLGQIVLASFNNPNGLQSLGGNQWSETSESGQPIPGAPGTGRLGLIQSAAIEESNVDLTKELVDMITQQRVYQANAQTIKTIDSVLQTLVNLR